MPKEAISVSNDQAHASGDSITTIGVGNGIGVGKMTLTSAGKAGVGVGVGVTAAGEIMGFSLLRRGR
ncbi:hypothetical protein [Planctomonas deserti]|uniref:hypothetical protein n=1 Tax=Planctomonas deserti TaxID=2144185 RepID=UPI00131F20F5|nr:hypothetical protein [Planctomonas deserti]